jgi:hypothetical protein
MVAPLLFVPVAEADFDAAAVTDELFEFFGVAAAVVVGVNDFWFEFLNSTGGLIDCHGVRKVHADESDVDVFEGAHFGDVLGVAADVDALAAEIENVTIATALGVKLEPFLGEIVHGNGFDIHTSNFLGFAVFEDGGFGFEFRGKLGGDSFGSDDFGVFTGNGFEGIGIEVIAVNVGDEDEVGFDAEFLESLSAADGIDKDPLLVGLHGEGGVVDGEDLDVALEAAGDFIGGRKVSGMGGAEEEETKDERPDNGFERKRCLHGLDFTQGEGGWQGGWGGD